MSSEIELLNLDEMTELLVVAAKNLLPEDDYSKGSDNWKRLRLVAIATTDANAVTASSYRDLWPDTANDVAADRHGEQYGVPRKGKVKASAEEAGLVIGDSGTSWTTDSVLVHSSGKKYSPTLSGTLDVTGQALIGLIATEGGEESNLDKGELLVFEVPIEGIEDEVELQKDIRDGSDSEGIGSFRSRILNRIGLPAMGGNSNDYESWIIESDDSIATAYHWPNRNGSGSVDISALKTGRGSARLLSTSELTELRDYVENLRPVHVGGLRAIEVVEEETHCEVTLIPEPSARFAKDWDDSTPPEVLTWDADTRLIVFAEARPVSLSVGHRIVIDDTSGESLTVESLDGENGLVVVESLGITPVAENLVYSGSSIVTSVRESILTLFDSLGPRVDEFGENRWVSTLFLSKLFEVIQTTEGVLDSSIVTPITNILPTLREFPDDESIGLLTPGNIIVRHQ